MHVSPESAQEAVKLRRELKSLGDVNLGAIDAFQTLSERHGELSNQRQDILDGKASVEEGIKELDRLTRERFDSTFALVQTAFRETFTTLFGGGEAELKRQQGPDELEAGVEVNVTIPGKRCQRLELLSGGERALSAVAFLFALLKVRPSPLVVLDEVDAPLDGRNVERTIALLESMSGITQFLVITHNPATIEAAPMWLGVTMQEPGVTTIVPYRSATKRIVEEIVPESFLTQAVKN
jgi:chromosome segregation protein